MSMLQASPSPLSSVSVCSGLLSNGQLSQRSPTPSLSESNCRGLYTNGQLSCVKHTHSCIHTHTYTHRGCEYSPVLSHGILKVTPCLRHSLTLSSMMSSLSSSGSQASPCPSLSRSSCPEFGSMGQLSCSQSQLSLMKSHPTTTLPANQIFLMIILPFDSDRLHSACRLICCWASHPDQSLPHTGSHRPQTRRRTHTCIKLQTPGRGTHTQHACGRCACCLCKDCMVHTSITKARIRQYKSDSWL